MRKLIATLLLIFWPGLMLAPAQRSIFFSQNVRPAATGGGPSLVQFAVFDDAGGGTSFPISITTTAGNTIVFAAIGNPNGTAAPVPSATGVTFTECTSCASTTGDRFVSHVYYSIGAAAITSISTTTIGSAYAFGVYELASVTGLDTGANLGTSFGTFSSAVANFTTTHANEFVIAASLSVPSSSLSGETWTIETGTPLADNAAITFYHATQATAGGGSFTSTFTSQNGRPTLSAVTFF